ncbi:hypothetical protein CEUSTIGMA_g9327.t1 [Chlamydomonas eustigma]|uniref:Allophanate hydrolase C-terminal domain-containing protein n=1 Tax=Chlamydomonas eustigma TaxID=1157962 RepID=A0A250XG68_9CHLO|nr:hypothetical protein CEUSTIGMA_g9327.t1 [Chlamydomonas eustigma]|eukprot:GAX81899.1 hypothetical protein CEUSTIGMA_g9327.t1 [Chlamydomonas eustigma]
MSTTTLASHLFITAVGAHMRGLPLNYQLTDLGATFVKEAKTAPVYRLYSMGPRPLLVRQTKLADSNSTYVGNSINLEVWSMPLENVGRFLQQIPSPLGLGTVELDSGECVKGFIGEAYAIDELAAVDITHLGGWRAHLAALDALSSSKTD